ncbi:LysR family transcriptional regulator substrate-binding protein [Saccharopolyspora shandongensis]|uniref:LysR family transcriptional regulator substrate-binding protein n=1 Tax=Saccharopolyspora shandongensis TaxID=418495 RepID=UPI0034088FE1
MSADAPQLRVGAVASALVRLVPNALSLLLSDWPASRVLTVQGDDDELTAWLAADTIDLAVTTQPCDGGRAAIEGQLEIADEFLAVLPRHHPRGSGGRIGLAEIVNAGVADPGGTCGPLLAAEFAARGVRWRPDHVVRDAETVLAMVAAGITAGIVPALAVPSPVPPEVALLPLDPPLHRPVYIRHARNQHAETFARILVACG